MAKKRYTLVLNFGYVENSCLAYMPWTSTDGYKDAKDAVLDLAAFLKEQYFINNKVKLKKCCEATKNKDATAKFCSKCGVGIADAEFDSEHFCDWLQQLDTDIDTFHGLIAWDTKHRWKTDGLEGSPNQRFVYQAEWVLAAALGHTRFADRTFETICKERTTQKKTSFSYY